MIGHYLLTLDAEQENRVLTGRVVPFKFGGPCLIMAIHPALDGIAALKHRAGEKPLLSPRSYRYSQKGLFGPPPGTITFDGPGYRYEQLCVRFGYERINAAIRNRILANQARRTLRCAPEAAHV